MLAMVIIYGGIVWLTVGESLMPVGQKLQEWVRNPLVLALHLTGAVEFVLAFNPRIIRGLRRGKESAATPPVPSAFTLPPEVSIVLIVRYAWLEAVAINGLIAAFVLTDWRLYLGLGALSAVGFLLSIPSEGLIRNLDEKLRQA